MHTEAPMKTVVGGDEHEEVKNKSFSLKQMAEIARKDLERKSNKGLLSFLTIEHQRALGAILQNGTKDEAAHKQKNQFIKVRRRESK